MKTLTYKGRVLEFLPPPAINFSNDFFKFIYLELYKRMIHETEYEPIWDVDEIHNDPMRAEILSLAVKTGQKVKKPSKRTSNKERAITQFHIRHFLKEHPKLSGLFLNSIKLAGPTIENAEFLLGQVCSADNFIEIKQIIDDQNRMAWSRDKDTSESQSGVSTLGTISEALLKRAFGVMADKTNFFKVGKSEVQTYGDFVLMCLPNNLWISVKSNFARERLLASGFTTDIIGAGFFESADEFTGQVRVRNFQRAGFLAMYCPDIAVSEEQMNDGTSTFELIEAHHRKNGTDMPKNINGRPFIRRLSNLNSDLAELLDEKDIRKRVTVSF